MVYYINYKKSQENNAGNKAPDDIAKICQELGFSEFSVPAMPKGLSTLKVKLWILLNAPSWWKKLANTVTEKDTVIYQHPMYGARLALKNVKDIKEKKGCKFIAIIHDLESLRNGVEGEYSVKKSTSEIADNQLLKLFDKIICHNERMIDYLVGKGFEREKLLNLQIFDYLCNIQLKTQKIDLSKPELIIAGNLNWGKSRYVYEFGAIVGEKSNIKVNVYGNGFDKNKASKALVYKGSFKPDELPGILEGNFGLVWDGVSADSCVGNTGEYLKYNDPHKTSLYIASGIPVIVWRQAAIAGFIIKHNIGIVIDSLYDVPNSIRKIKDDEYEQMKINTMLIGEKLREGFYTKQVLNKAV